MTSISLASLCFSAVVQRKMMSRHCLFDCWPQSIVLYDQITFSLSTFFPFFFFPSICTHFTGGGGHSSTFNCPPILYWFIIGLWPINLLLLLLVTSTQLNSVMMMMAVMAAVMGSWWWWWWLTALGWLIESQLYCVEEERQTLVLFFVAELLRHDQCW